jgi:hypothetical protein
LGAVQRDAWDEAGTLHAQLAPAFERVRAAILAA